MSKPIIALLLVATAGCTKTLGNAYYGSSGLADGMQKAARETGDTDVIAAVDFIVRRRYGPDVEALVDCSRAYLNGLYYEARWVALTSEDQENAERGVLESAHVAATACAEKSFADPGASSVARVFASRAERWSDSRLAMLACERQLVYATTGAARGEFLRLTEQLEALDRMAPQLPESTRGDLVARRDALRARYAVGLANAALYLHDPEVHRDTARLFDLDREQSQLQIDRNDLETADSQCLARHRACMRISDRAYAATTAVQTWDATEQNQLLNKLAIRRAALGLTDTSEIASWLVLR